MDEIQIPANKLFTRRVVTFLSGVLMVVLVLFPNSSCKQLVGTAVCLSCEQPGPLSLVQECRGLALIGRE